MLEEERGGGGGGGDGAGMSEEKPKVKKEKKRKKRRRSSSSGNGDGHFYCSTGLRKFQHASLEYRYTPVRWNVSTSIIYNVGDLDPDPQDPRVFGLPDPGFVSQEVWIRILPFSHKVC